MRYAFQAAALCLLMLAACGSTQQGSRPVGLVMVNLLSEQVKARAAARLPPPVNAAAILTRQNLAAIGEPLIRITATKSGFLSLLYIAQRNGDAQIWKSPDNVSFTLRDGIVTQTRGLGEDIYATDIARLQAALRGADSTAGLQRIIQRMDGTNTVVPLQYRCDVTNLGAEAVVVLGQSFATQHYREDCKGADGDFVNDYWIDSRGVMRVSQQWIGADFGYVLLERLID